MDIHQRFPILSFLRRTCLSTLVLSCAATFSSFKWDIHQALAFTQYFFPNGNRVFTFRCSRETGKSQQMEEQSHRDLGISSSIENLQKSIDIDTLANSKHFQAPSVFNTRSSKAGFISLQNSHKTLAVKSHFCTTAYATF